MPITVTVTAGVLDKAAEASILPRLSQALLARHELVGHPFMTPAVVGSLNVVPEGHIFTGGKAERAIFVELKVPSVTFTTQQQRQGYLDDVNAILDDLTRGTYPKDKTFLNITYAVDGSWGIGAKAYTNQDLSAAITAAASAVAAR